MGKHIVAKLVILGSIILAVWAPGIGLPLFFVALFWPPSTPALPVPRGERVRLRGRVRPAVQVEPPASSSADGSGEPISSRTRSRDRAPGASGVR